MVGNEGKLQKVWQCIPLRPQKIFILGMYGTVRDGTGWVHFTRDLF